MDTRGTYIAAVLERIALLSRSLTASRDAPLGTMSLSSSQYAALFFLAHSDGPVSPSGLARALAVTPGAVTQLVDGLTAAGLVQTSPHPTDARRRIIGLTRSARDEIVRYEEAAVERMRERFDPLPDEDLHHLAGLLKRVGEAS